MRSEESGNDFAPGNKPMREKPGKLRAKYALAGATTLGFSGVIANACWTNYKQSTARLPEFGSGDSDLERGNVFVRD
jgi:hypothetical protein